MRIWRRGAYGVVLGWAVGLAGIVEAQDGGAPIVRAENRGEAVSPAATAVLTRTVALRLEQVSLDDALTTLAVAGRFTLSYSVSQLPADKVVSLTAASITVRDALDQLLSDTRLDVVASSTGRIRIQPRTGEARARHVGRAWQAGGTIAGRVTDGATRAPLDQVSVRLEGVGTGAVTTSDGRYVLHAIAPGSYHITARRVGYTPFTKTVTVVTDSTAAADFTLAAAPTRLSEMVTTAVGDQRRIELGNSIATINADSVVQHAPITSLTDVMSGRAPGVEVLESSGIAGSPVRIRIRGLSSLQLSNDPIVYVDGVRINSDAGYTNPAVPYLTGSFNPPSRLNDLNPDEIASVEVLKGPSAATEYGTDAANGVIVIKTKQGHAGAPRWELNAGQGLTDVPANFPVPWYGWGHTTDASRTPVECPLTNGFSAPSVGAKTCVLDSVTTYQPLDHAPTSVLTTGRSQQYNVQVSGGVQQLRYFVGGSVASQTGVLHLDPVDATAMIDSGRSIPSYARTPNVTNGTTLRGRFMAPLAATADLALTTSYLSNYQRGAPVADIIQGAESGLGYRDPAYNGWYPAFGGSQGYLPRDFLLNTASQAVSRFTGGFTATWRPSGWLAAHATVAVDAGTENDLAFRATPEPVGTFGEFTNFSGINEPNFRGIVRQTTDVYTADLGATVTIPLTRVVTAKTSAGVQYNDRRQSGTSLMAYGVSLNNSFNGAQIAVPGEVGEYVKTFGSYVEEMVGFDERLFVTGAIRVDAGSGFGSDVHSAVYPKASASWLLWDMPRQSVRVRAAYGASGVQPKAGSTLTLFGPGAAIVGGTLVAADSLGAFGNPRLKPERQSEFEGGVDASLLARRVDVDLTYYTKVSHDALVNVTLPASVGARTEEENIGSVRNYGFEGSLTLHVLDARPVQWDVIAGGSVNTNRLVSLAPGVPPIDGAARSFQAQYRDVPGYPVDGMWAPLLHYQDLNHDGIIEPNEVSIDQAMSYMGPSLPTRELTLSTSVGLWRGRLRVNTQLDHRGGFTIENFNYENNVDGTLSSPALNNPRTPLREQARAVAGQLFYSPLNSGYMENGTFTRWRELSVRYQLPDWFAHAIHGQSASIAVGGRNLALWTHYTGPDPEVTTVGGYAGNLPIDASYDFYSFPLVRTWLIRLDLGF